MARLPLLPRPPPRPPRLRSHLPAAATAAAPGSVERVLTMRDDVTCFPALGTEVFLAVRRPADLAPARRLAQRVLTDVDETCSRFRDDSDLTRVNRHPGRWVEVDPLLLGAVEVALEAARRTGGLVSPLLGRPLVQLGYDRDFALLVERAAHPASEPAACPSLDAWREVHIADGLLRIPAGTALDLGATGKAWAADLVATACEQEGLGAAVVSVGGDVRVVAPDGRPWQVAVAEHPGSSGRDPGRPRRRRPGDLDHPGTPLGPRRGTAPPPARPPHRTADAGAVAHGDRHRPHLRRRQHRDHGGGRAGRRRPSVARAAGGARPAGGQRRSRRHARRLARGGGGMTEGPLLWFLNRGSGVVLLVLLTLSTVLGVLALAGGRPGRGVPRFVSQSLHRNLALLSVVALLVHVVTAVVDTFVDIRWWQAMVPVGATYEPLWLGLGTLSLDLIVVVVLTSLLRTHLGHRRWHAVHLLSWLAWAVGVAHGIGIGTDLREPVGWAVVPVAASVAAVGLVVAYRGVLLLRPSTTTPDVDRAGVTW